MLEVQSCPHFFNSGPIANVRILYKVFTYMVLARVEPVLKANQPEEQHGFRAGRRLAEHLVSANLVIDKLLAVGKPVWIFYIFFSPAPFCRRISVLDCCTGQSPGKGNEMTVVLVSLQATK